MFFIVNYIQPIRLEMWKKILELIENSSFYNVYFQS